MKLSFFERHCYVVTGVLAVYSKVSVIARLNDKVIEQASLETFSHKVVFIVGQYDELKA